MDTSDSEKQRTGSAKSTFKAWHGYTQYGARVPEIFPLANISKDTGLRQACTYKSMEDWSGNVDMTRSSTLSLSSTNQNLHPYTNDWARPHTSVNSQFQSSNTISNQTYSLRSSNIPSDIAHVSKRNHTTVLETVSDRYSYLYSPITPSTHNVAVSPAYKDPSASTKNMASQTSVGVTGKDSTPRTNIFNFESLHSVANGLYHNDSLQSEIRPVGNNSTATSKTAPTATNSWDSGRSVTFGPASFTPRHTGNSQSTTTRQSSYTYTGNQQRKMLYNVPSAGQTMSNNNSGWTNLGHSLPYHGGQFEKPSADYNKVPQPPRTLRQSLHAEEGNYADDTIRSSTLQPISHMSAASGAQRYSVPNLYKENGLRNCQTSHDMLDDRLAERGFSCSALVSRDVQTSVCERGCEDQLHPFVDIFHRIGHSSNTSRVHLKDQNDFLVKLIFDQQGNFKYHLSCLTRIFKISRRRFRRVHSKCLKSVEGQQEVHGLKGRPSNNRKAAETRLQFVQFVRDMRVVIGNDHKLFYLADNVSSIQGWFPSSLRMRFNDNQLKMLAKYEKEKAETEGENRSNEVSNTGESSDTQRRGAQERAGHERRPSFQTISNSTCQRWFKRFFSSDTFIYAQHCRRTSMENDLEGGECEQYKK
ncbi:hypothetical protein SARC_00524 [Sphaeroforma arctica JP610]|uniref:Uncharacterized protein n=1 Tax=Sphaeroforma arctica JP610 TaxID=667725 RepID=A0A0L0GGD8_9EUKA|nr:hypothetical protein SARC_00524 [Sphaeroforma arctica JP610]KNC87383.1 hypothetical protein SARC_00524 [Sphaeroforma arctica JP610]|eukprot:XP_014161285.1 hypothetical protein SARC_00524 [Sphaeroforma arctica JP610]